MLQKGWRAEALPEGAAAGVRGRAPNDYCRGSGSVTQGGGLHRYWRGRRQASGGDRWATTLMPVLPEGATVGGAGDGERWCEHRGSTVVTGEVIGGVIGEAGGCVMRGVDRWH